MPRIDDTESVEKSLLHTEANFYDFLTAGAGLLRFFADFKQKNLWKMKIRIEKKCNLKLFFTKIVQNPPKFGENFHESSQKSTFDEL